MGMYDEVVCQYELPDQQLKDEVFQTKCLDSLMQRYRISEDGELFVLKIITEWVEDPDDFLGGHIETLSSWEDKINYHGYINIYTSTDEGWVEYRVKFTDGKLVSIERVEEE